MASKSVLWRLIKSDYEELLWRIKKASEDNAPEYTKNAAYIVSDRLCALLTDYKRAGGKRSIDKIAETLTGKNW